MLSHCSSVTLTGGPPAAEMTQILLVAMLPKSSFWTNCLLPETQAIQRPSGDGLQECASSSRAPPRPGVPSTARTSTESPEAYTIDFPSGNQAASSQPPGGRGTRRRGDPPSAGIVSIPRSELNASICPSGDQCGIRA